MNELMTAIAEHLTIVAISMVFAAIIGIALGVLSYWKPRVGRYIIGIAEIIQTIPSLALLALLMIIFGLGDLTMGVALVLYALLPIIRNTYTSLTERLVKVEIPLSIPMIFGGLKVALVNSLSIAVMGVLIGSGGLGYIIYRGIQQRNMDRILLGAIPVVVIALIFDWGMGKAEKRLQKHAR